MFVWLLETKILHVILSLDDSIKSKLFRFHQTGYLMVIFQANDVMAFIDW